MVPDRNSRHTEENASRGKMPWPENASGRKMPVAGPGTAATLARVSVDKTDDVEPGKYRPRC